MKILEESINNPQLLSKEERNRELSYINFLLYGSSRLLKRPINQKILSAHIETSVEIGIDDALDKGLGFELANLNDPSHPYSQMESRHKEIMTNKRQQVTEFIIKICEKLIEQQTTETTHFIHISRILMVNTITYGVFVTDFEKLWKNHSHSKSTLANRLKGKKTCMRDELVIRVTLQYKFRSFHIHTMLNELDLRVIETLFKLATGSIYAVVRKDAQTQLFSVLAHFPYSTLVVVPRLVEMLSRCDASVSEELRLTHDQLKGCLYLLKGRK